MEDHARAMRSRSFRGLGAYILASFALLLWAPPAMGTNTLNLSLAGSTGSGSIVSSPAGINCTIEAGGTQSGTCSSTGFADGSSVTLTATPKSTASIFNGWTAGSGTCTGPATTSQPRTPCQVTAGSFGGVISLTAKFVPKPAPPAAVTGAAGAGPASWLRVLFGHVDPEGFRVDECRFEYGLTTDYGSNTGCVPGAAGLGEGSSAIAVSAETEPLEPNTIYHFRLVAANLGGIGKGQDLTFATGALPADPCPNANRRAEQGIATFLLPVCMALEQVSPPHKDSQPAKFPVVSADGDRVAFTSSAALGGSPGVIYLSGEPYVARRGASDWFTEPTRPPVDELIRGWAGGARSFSPDLSSWLHLAASMEESERGAGRVFAAGAEGVFNPISPPMEPFSDGTPTTLSSTEFQGASADHSHVVFSSSVRYQDGDPVPTGPNAGSDSYVAHLRPDGGSDLELLARDEVGPDAGKAWGGTCGARLAGSVTSRGAISADGLRSFIAARAAQAQGGTCSTTNRFRILERTETPGGPDITEPIANECDRVSLPACSTVDGDDVFLTASLDQSKLYFTTTRQLADTDLDATSDLYLYDATKLAGSRLTQVSAGGVGAVTPGEGANVAALTALSGDGSHAYFASNDVLTTGQNPEGKAAEAGKANLYLYTHPAGQISFVATLTAGDGGSYPVPLIGSNPLVGADGHVLVFNSKASLTQSDADGGFRDVFRYDPTEPPSGQLRCVSCRGPPPDSAPFDVLVRTDPIRIGTDFAETGRWVSEDGESIVFRTAEALIPGDANDVVDSYLWRDGQFYRLPGTNDPEGTKNPEAGLRDTPVLSHDGDEVAFQSTAQLLPTDIDSTKDVYVARVEGGFKFPDSPFVCAGEGCQAPFASQPATESPTSEAAGLGNLPGTNPPRARRCPSGKRKAKRQGKVRCVARHDKKARNRAAGTGRRSTR